MRLAVVSLSCGLSLMACQISDGAAGDVQSLDGALPDGHTQDGHSDEIGDADQVVEGGSFVDVVADGRGEAAVSQPDSGMLDASDADPDGPPSCPSGLPGPSMVLVAVDSRPFCMDSTEVTQAQYAGFVQAVEGGQSLQQPERCDWNDVLVAPTEDPGEEGEPGTCPAGSYDPTNLSTSSVVCVDWCDAAAYCSWAGKRLCSEHTLTAATDATTQLLNSEWRFACTNGGTTAYPYGDNYVLGVCVDEGFSRPGTGTEGSAACIGMEEPFDGIRDLPGSVVEWSNMCFAFDCAIQGGGMGSVEVGCASGAITPYRSVRADLGFRCCSDA